MRLLVELLLMRTTTFCRLIMPASLRVEGIICRLREWNEMHGVESSWLGGDKSTMALLEIIGNVSIVAEVPSS